MKSCAFSSGKHSYIVLVCVLALSCSCKAITDKEKKYFRDKAKEIFYHGFNSYMDYAYPADELMPLSCKGRWRGSEPCRGDIDDALGNFSLTLIDSMDTLAILGDFDGFGESIKLIVNDVTFDTDATVSVFETNIRVLGGLLSGHVLAEYIKGRYGEVMWYKGELLSMAQDLGYRLLPAFNTTTGIPHARINLRYGMRTPLLENSRETCTACAGTMVLEFAALSRLTGDPVFEIKAHKAMDQLWTFRNRASDLVGTVLNVHSGEWVRRESGVGAGIDSYYEYCLKAYILLGDERYNSRFNKHYQAIMKYVSQGPILLDVHMHRPNINSKNFMDSLQAFWPGLQVLKGDLQPAVETHEMLYQVMQKHNFLPEAFTTDFQVHWGQHPLRPEFVESTYFLYRATNDPHYLDVGAKIIESLEKYARVQCGYAAVKDVRTGVHEDKMDSFVLTETFKYLYLLFAEPADLKIDVEQFVFTTEAHLLPLSLARLTNITAVPLRANQSEDVLEDIEMNQSCPAPAYLFANDRSFLQNVRKRVQNSLSILAPSGKEQHRRLLPAEFQAANPEHLTLLREMGITVITLADGKVQLLHSTQLAKTQEDAREGLQFMHDMVEFSKLNEAYDNGGKVAYFRRNGEDMVLKAGPGQFGPQLVGDFKVSGEVVLAEPRNGCGIFSNGYKMKDKIVVVQRGDCMFIDKVRQAQAFGAAGVVVGDYPSKTGEQKSAALFSMSGDGKDDVIIPSVFVLAEDAELVMEALKDGPLVVTLAETGPTEGGHFEATPAAGVGTVETVIVSEAMASLRDELVKKVQEKLKMSADFVEIELWGDSDQVMAKGEVYEVPLDENSNFITREIDGSSVISPVAKKEPQISEGHFQSEFLATLGCLVHKLLEFHSPRDTNRLPHEEIGAKYNLLADLSARLQKFKVAELVVPIRDAYKSFKGSSAGIAGNLIGQVIETVKILKPILAWPDQYYEHFNLVFNILRDDSTAVYSEEGYGLFVECLVSHLQNSGGVVSDLKDKLLTMIEEFKSRTDGSSSERDEL